MGRNTAQMLWKDVCALCAFMHHTYAYFKGSYCIIRYSSQTSSECMEVSGNYFFCHRLLLTGLLIPDLLRQYPCSVTTRVTTHFIVSLIPDWHMDNTMPPFSSPLSLPTPLTRSLHLQLGSPTPSLSPMISWLHENVCSISCLVCLSLSHIFWRQRFCSHTAQVSWRYKTLPMHKHAFIRMQQARTQTCTDTIDGNLACMITATLSCLGVLSHLALVFATSTLPLTPTHTNRPFSQPPPSSSPIIHSPDRKSVV